MHRQREQHNTLSGPATHMDIMDIMEIMEIINIMEIIEIIDMDMDIADIMDIIGKSYCRIEPRED